MSTRQSLGDADAVAWRGGRRRRAGSDRRAETSGRSVVALILASAALAGCGGGGSATTSAARSTAPATTTAPATIRATLTAPTHRPVVDAPWTYVVRVRDAAGRPVRARVHLQAMFQGVAVGEIGDHRVLGVWRETINWPAASVGQALVFHVEVTGKGSTVTLDYPLTVQPE